jgi:hypothetical protein
MLDGQHDDCAAKQEGAVTFNQARSPSLEEGRKDGYFTGLTFIDRGQGAALIGKRK